VEHPITELITGVDLVEQMIRIAAGLPLPKKMVDNLPLPINGWATESRVYAEDPLRGFLPSTGRLLKYSEPTECPGVRVDSGITEGSDISMYYDPMICKLTTWGKDREESIDRMQTALNHYVIQGPGHNLNFLHDCYRHPRYREGNLTTKFIEEEYPEGFSGVQLTPEEHEEARLAAVVMKLAKAAYVRKPQHSLVNAETPHAQEVRINVGGHTLVQRDNITTSGGLVPHFEVDAEDSELHSIAESLGKESELQSKMESLYLGDAGAFGSMHKVGVLQLSTRDGNDMALLVNDGSKTFVIDEVDWKIINDPLFSMNVDGRKITLQRLKTLPGGNEQLFHNGASVDTVVRTENEQELSEHMVPKAEVDHSKSLLCPMPGMLVSVAVKPGDTVEIGQELAVVEAMKMQNVLAAEKKGVVKEVLRQPGEPLKVDEIIINFE